MASLEFLAGSVAGRVYQLGDGEYLIGRRSDCHICIPDMGVSRQHARVRRESGQWFIEDLGSNNGTYVNGQRVQWVGLQDRDEICIANIRIRVKAPAAPVERVEDSQVTLVSVDDAQIFVSTEHSADSFDGHALEATRALEAAASSGRDVRLLERKLQAISSLLEVAAKVQNPTDLLEAIVARLLDVFPQASSVGVLVADGRGDGLKVQCQRRRAEDDGLAFSVPGTLIDHVVSDRRGILLGRVKASSSMAVTGAAAGDEPAGTRMGAPLLAYEQSYGVLYVECERGTFRQDDVDLLTSIAAQAGMALRSEQMHQQLRIREQLERDVRVARQIQRSLLPKQPPDVLGLEFAVHYEPAYEIGGDFYDFIWHDPRHLGIVVGDVAGKAISAALYMARLTSELRSRASIVATPQQLLRRVNQAMLQIGDEGMFATLAYAIYDLDTRLLTFTNAGHVSPLLRRDGRILPLYAERAHTAPIGILGDLEVGEAHVQLESGDLLVMVTDGIHEARDQAGREYGSERLARRVQSVRGRPVDVVTAILRDVDDHVGSAAQGDDITIVSMQVGRMPARHRARTDPPG
jgi:serine phosphatase RsbU (regulator of sigma subunit)